MLGGGYGVNVNTNGNIRRNSLRSLRPHKQTYHSLLRV